MGRKEHEALQRRWSQVLWARIEQLSRDSTITDEGELARQAWADCAKAYPQLRKQLDAHRDGAGSATFRSRELAGSSFVA